MFINVKEVRDTHSSKLHRIRCQNQFSSNNAVMVRRRVPQIGLLTLRKLLWTLIIGGLMVICLWHMVDRILYYWKEPTSFQVSVSRLNHVTFPAITICPGKEPFEEDDLDHDCKTPNFSNSTKANFSLEDIWNEYAVTENDINISAPCNEKNVCNMSHNYQLTLKSSALDTVAGHCITLSQGSPVKFRNGLTFWEIILKPGPYEQKGPKFKEPYVAQLFLHYQQDIQRHDAQMITDDWISGKSTKISFTISKYEFLNLSRDPCYNEADIARCKNKCFDENLDRIVNCSLPFMKSKWPSCSTVCEVKKVIEHAYSLYNEYDSLECNCKRHCREHIIEQLTDTKDNYDNQTGLLISFRDNLVEQVSEQYAYSFPALVSDIGGSMGLFLGLSVFHLLKLLGEFLEARMRDVRFFY